MNIQMIGTHSCLSPDNCSSFLINDYILVGVPTGTLENLIKFEKDLDKIKVIIITSLDLEYISGLPKLLLREASRLRKDKLIIIGPKGLKKTLSKLIKVKRASNLKYLLSKINIVFMDPELVQDNEIMDGLYLTFIKTNQYKIKNSYGFILKNNNNSFGYISKTRFCLGVSYILNHVQYAIISISDNKKDINLISFTKFNADFKVRYFPVNLDEKIISELTTLRNVKLLKQGEQFYI